MRSLEPLLRLLLEPENPVIQPDDSLTVRLDADLQLANRGLAAVSTARLFVCRPRPVPGHLPVFAPGARVLCVAVGGNRRWPLLGGFRDGVACMTVLHGEPPRVRERPGRIGGEGRENSPPPGNDGIRSDFFPPGGCGGPRYFARLPAGGAGPHREKPTCSRRPVHPARMKGGAALTSAGPSVIGAGFALPRVPTGGRRSRACAPSALPGARRVCVFTTTGRRSAVTYLRAVPPQNTPGMRARRLAG